MELPNPPEWRLGPYMLPINEGGEGEPSNPITRRWLVQTFRLLEILLSPGNSAPDNFKTTQGMFEEKVVLACVRMAWAMLSDQEIVIKRDFAQFLVKKMQKAGLLDGEES